MSVDTFTIIFVASLYLLCSWSRRRCSRDGFTARRVSLRHPHWRLTGVFHKQRDCTTRVVVAACRRRCVSSSLRVIGAACRRRRPPLTPYCVVELIKFNLI